MFILFTIMNEKHSKLSTHTNVLNETKPNGENDWNQVYVRFELKFSSHILNEIKLISIEWNVHTVYERWEMKIKIEYSRLHRVFESCSATVFVVDVLYLWLARSLTRAGTHKQQSLNRNNTCQTRFMLIIQ